MCGRARCALSRACVVREAGVSSSSEFVNGDKYSPAENMAPGSYTPVVYQASGLRDSSGAAAEASAAPSDTKPQMRVEAMRWGLVPSFTKPHATPDHFVMFNARSDTLRERPAFRRLLESRRCVVLCDGYYEWQQVDKKEKQPYYFFQASRVMKFAGLYDSWTSSDGETMHSFTILTTDAAPHLQWLHTRMPVILTDDGAARWTSSAKFATLQDLLQPYTGADLQWHPVDKRLGSTKFQSPDCAKKVDIKHAGDITAFFSSGKKALKPEKPEADRTDATAVPKHEAPTAGDTQAIKTEASEQTPGSPARAEGFVLASSLLGKRSASTATSKSSRSSPLRSAPSPQTKKLKAPLSPQWTAKRGAKSPAGAAGKKQGTLLAFFQPKGASS